MDNDKKYLKAGFLNADNKEKFFCLRNLKDAGFNEKMIKEFFQLNKEGKERKQLDLLLSQRKTLLQRVHNNQKKIDCLDFLIFKTKENGNSDNKTQKIKKRGG